jgi:hypothetical protein
VLKDAGKSIILTFYTFLLECKKIIFKDMENDANGDSQWGLLMNEIKEHPENFAGKLETIDIPEAVEGVVGES